MKSSLFLLVASLFPMVAVTASATEVMAAQNDADRNFAIQLFNAKQFAPAVEKFAHIVKNQPRDAISQYYLGVALTHLGKSDQAYNHFGSAYLAAPESQAGKYSIVMINRISAARSTAQAHASAIAADDDSSTDPVPAAHSPVLQTILSQANEKSAVATREQEAFNHRVLAKDDESIARFADQSVRQVTHMQFIPGSLPASHDEVVRTIRSNDEELEELKRLRESHATQLQEATEHESLALRQSTTYIEDQIQEPPSQLSSIRISPVGTNLYVRNYFDSRKTSAPPMPELLADQDRLLLESHHKKTAELTADQDKLLLQKKIHIETLNVKGRLIER